MAIFPSEQWFEEVRQLYNSDKSLHSGGGGACDTTAGFSIGDLRFRIEFAGLECANVRKSDDAELLQTDFIIEMSPAAWQDMVKDVQENGKASSNHTLNSLDLDLEDGIARSPVDDQYKQDLFYRYNQNFQDFFNASSRIETRFDEPV